MTLENKEARTLTVSRKQAITVGGDKGYDRGEVFYSETRTVGPGENLTLARTELFATVNAAVEEQVKAYKANFKATSGEILETLRHDPVPQVTANSSPFKRLPETASDGIQAKAQAQALMAATPTTEGTITIGSLLDMTPGQDGTKLGVGTILANVANLEEIHSQKTGKTFYKLMLKDSTGTIGATLWSRPTFELGDTIALTRARRVITDKYSGGNALDIGNYAKIEVVSEASVTTDGDEKETLGIRWS